MNEPMLSAHHASQDTTAQQQSDTSFVHTPQVIIRKRYRSIICGAVVLSTLLVTASAAEQADNPVTGTQATSSTPSSLAHANLQLTAPSSTVSTTPEQTQTVVTDTTPSTTNTQGNSSGQSGSTVSVSVNGQSVSVPANGSNENIITTPDGSISVQVSHTSTTSGDAYGSTGPISHTITSSTSFVSHSITSTEDSSSSP